MRLSVRQSLVPFIGSRNLVVSTWIDEVCEGDKEYPLSGVESFTLPQLPLEVAFRLRVEEHEFVVHG